MDDDENEFVTFGTALAIEEADEEAPRKKPVPIDQQEVRDERGLRRFHGAFTGGFSAGYYNTVGTKEGWTPSTFLSSRAERAGEQNQRPEDYMDTEDLGVFGIAPRAIQVNKEFDVDEKSKDSKGTRKRQFQFNQGAIPGLPPLKDLIVPSRDSAGVKLLRKMGWRPGQGIGPRVKTKKKRKSKSVSINKEPENPGVKIYGCFLPEDVSLQEDSDDDELFDGITFAPDDVEVMAIKAKDNFHGIGYTGLDRNPILATFRSGQHAIAAPPVRDNKKKLAITGEAFGVGVYEEDDENIYCVDDMAQYDFELGANASSKKEDDRKLVKDDRKKTIGRVSEILEGFHLSTKPLSSKKSYPLPQLPRNFQPFHGKTGDVSAGAKHETSVLDRHRMTATERAEIVGTDKPKGSVFDLLRPEDRERLTAITNKNNPALAASSELQSQSSSSPATSSSIIPSMISQTSRGRIGPSGFQPFANDVDKQKRYDLYIKFKDGKTDEAVFQKCQPPTMTEWEKQREVGEFCQASAIYRPLAHGMALRFVTAKETDIIDIQPKMAKTNKTSETHEKKTTIELKYGSATRTKIEWHPDPLLCRRFNIPNPYPESTFVGVLKFKRDKFSVFNLFGVANQQQKAIRDETLAIDLPQSQSSSKKILLPDGEQETPPNSETTKKEERPNLFANLDDIDILPSATPINVDSTKDDDSDKEAEATTTRPSFDIYKAIFEDTDSEDSLSISSISEEQNIGEVVEKAILASVEKVPWIKNTEKKLLVRSKVGLFTDLNLDNIDEVLAAPVETVKKVADLKVPSPRQSSSNECSYGPALPPTLSQTNVSTSIDIHKHRGRKSHKSKHRRKHKRSKLEEHVKSSQSKHSGDSETTSQNSERNSIKLIKSRLKK